ncbi:hypothetical protein INT47_007090 [Mucor saturninus]|uniref:Uncharacterized protein n=1 Tax=Mucor saturninus TaxID=64648 RepID=A0A8H7UZC4_9FUNG|nr:hypothetical protein INT47_007090 [Mucor saturninus]
MTTFFDNAHYYSNGPKVEDNPYQLDKTDFNDFFIDNHASGPVSSFCRDNGTWEYITSQLREQIFNSTSIAYSPPETYLAKKAKRDHPSSHVTAMLSMISKNTTSNPFTADPLEFRRYRSENLLVRMIHCKSIGLDMSQISLMRLSKGVFVHQIWQSCSPQSSPTMSAIEDSLSNRFIDASAEAPIDTFRFDNVFSMVNHLTTSYDMFVPYSYTFGARFTNPYGHAHDLVIRGKIPLWCQTLFLSVCMKQSAPIQPNVPTLGLFPFAPQIPVTFKPFIETYGISPDLTVLYEKCTMEHADPFTMSDTEAEWPEKRQEILQDILVCDLEDGLAKILSDMAVVWATSQGLMI